MGRLLTEMLTSSLKQMSGSLKRTSIKRTISGSQKVSKKFGSSSVSSKIIWVSGGKCLDAVGQGHDQFPRP